MDPGARIIAWYQQNKRDLPWRHTREPYRVWLSEIILQQTRVDQGMPYYMRFLEAFPTLSDLAKASPNDILRIWQGLGYYSRAHHLHQTARYIIDTLNGLFPDNFQELKKLKGIGDYTAAAIASFCYDEPVVVMDGNVHRVIARMFGLYFLPIAVEAKNQYRLLATTLLADYEPGLFNQSIMEFGALCCKPSSPSCHECPVQMNCFAFKQAAVKELPLKKIKKPLRIRYFNYFHVTGNDHFIVSRRELKDIWLGLFEFPMVETPTKQEWPSLKAHGHFPLFLRPYFYENTPTLVEICHILSHQKIVARFWITHSPTPVTPASPYLLVHEENLNEYPFAKLTHTFIDGGH